ncbi:GntR family transcriptional regulator [Balneatrix alpica]|uniref:GntR family transcriptional regulator n=1 Tax=Balneatrix alpica TaxID=75684 RepID=A0ABV5ZCF6_9GAMM|nr:GntR family transcriptional regulator [Balneatrix alpica]
MIEQIFGDVERLKQYPGPLYRQLQQRLREAVESGLLQPGTALPAERELATGLGVSRVTVRRAIDDLVEEGLLTQRQGAGTFVSERVEQPLNYLKSFTEIMRERGRSPASRWIDRSLSLANEEELRMLRLPVGSEVVRLYRLRLADDKPMGLELASVPAAVIDNPFSLQGSLYEALAAAGQRPVRALQRIRAINIDKARAGYLQIPVESAVLYIERLGLSAEGVPVEFTRSYFPGDAYDFVAEIRDTDSPLLAR